MNATEILNLVEEIKPEEEEEGDVVFGISPLEVAVKEGTPLAKYVAKAIKIAEKVLKKPFTLSSIVTNSPEFGLYTFLIEPKAYVMKRNEMIAVVKEIDYNPEFKVWNTLGNAIRIGVNEKTED